MSQEQERLNETTHIIVFLTIAVVVIAILYSKNKKNKESYSVVMSWLCKLQFFLPFFIIYRHRFFLNVVLWGWGISGLCCLITHWFRNHRKKDFRIRNGLEGLILVILLTGLMAIAGSWFYLFCHYYAEACGWLQKYVLGR
jgi:hypothetical protein